MKALIIVDIQNDFLPGGALAVPQGHEIIPLINRLQPCFDLVVATQDWHPAGHGSFASSHQGKAAFTMHELGGMPQMLWPEHCVSQTMGAQLADTLDQALIESVFRKGTHPGIDSYSAFFDNGKQKSTALADYLKGKGITRVFVCGLAADYCVAYTAEDAIDEGFKTFIVEDATRYIDAETYNNAKEKLHLKGVKFISSANILED